MPHTKEKKMINTNRAVVVNFEANAITTQVTTNGTADIYVPFKVSQINIKGIDLDFETDFRAMYFTSNWVDYGPLGSGFAGILYDNSTSTKQMTYLFQDTSRCYRIVTRRPTRKSTFYVRVYWICMSIIFFNYQNNIIKK